MLGLTVSSALIGEQHQNSGEPEVSTDSSLTETFTLTEKTRDFLSAEDSLNEISNSSLDDILRLVSIEDSFRSKGTNIADGDAEYTTWGS